MLFFSNILFGEEIYAFENPVYEKRFSTLLNEIRCPKCTSGSLASSDAPISRDLKNKIYEKMGIYAFDCVMSPPESGG